MRKKRVMCPHAVKISLPCSSTQECLELAEALTRIRGLRAPLIKHRVKKTSVEVTIVGSSTEIALTKRLIIKTYEQVKRKTSG
ncbi:MAG: hypothetical protein QXV93_04985 [Zestosphaera sp.]